MSAAASVAIIDDPARDAGLCQWIGEITGGTVRAVQRIGGGAFRAAARLQLDGAAGLSEIFLKIDLGSAPATGYDLQREYELLRALNDLPVRTPVVLGFSAEWKAMAMKCLPGHATYAELGEDTAWRARVEADFVGALAEVHRVDLAAMHFNAIPPGRTALAAMQADIAAWKQKLLAGVAAPDAVTLFALAWLNARLPASDRAAVLVQGDAGPGNFLFDDQGVTGLVDWEMAHLGHPLEDLGCVLARSLMQPMMDAGRLIKLYEAASGEKVARDELIYATVLLMTRFSVPIELALESRTTALDYGLTSAYFRLSQISILTLIAAAEGIAVDDTSPPEGTPPAIGFELNYLAAMLGDVIRPALTDAYSRYRLDGAQALVGYIAKVVASAPAPAAAAPQDYVSVIAQGPAAITPVLQELLAQARYREALMAGMLGPLAGRRVVI
jgi:aminoglycoside phosphotransferase